jgi:hypothetical protein
MSVIPLVLRVYDGESSPLRHSDNRLKCFAGSCPNLHHCPHNTDELGERDRWQGSNCAVLGRVTVILSWRLTDDELHSLLQRQADGFIYRCFELNVGIEFLLSATCRHTAIHRFALHARRRYNPRGPRVDEPKRNGDVCLFEVAAHGIENLPSWQELWSNLHSPPASLWFKFGDSTRHDEFGILQGCLRR